MFVDLDWPLNTSSLLSASAELLVEYRIESSGCPRQVRVSVSKQLDRSQFMTVRVPAGWSTRWCLLAVYDHAFSDHLRQLQSAQLLRERRSHVVLCVKACWSPHLRRVVLALANHSRSPPWFDVQYMAHADHDGHICFSVVFDFVPKIVGRP